MSNTLDLFSSEETPVANAPSKAREEAKTPNQQSALLVSQPAEAKISIAIEASIEFETKIETGIDAEVETSAKFEDRKTPDSWAKYSGSIPEAFRSAVYETSWAIHDKILAQCQGDAEKSSATDRNSAVVTALSNLSYASFLPFHLVKPTEMADALTVLKKDVYEFACWVKEKNPNADRLLVIGDAPDPQDLAAVLKKNTAEHPARMLLCGPGRSVESSVRAFAEKRNYVPSAVMSVDHDARGANWDQVPGKKLDLLVDRLFYEMKPDRIVVFEPSRMPATVQVINKARQMNIPIAYCEGQDLIATAKTTAYAKP